LLLPLGVAQAKPFRDGFSTIVRSQTDEDLTWLLGWLNRRGVTTASAAMPDRVTFVM
jgi:hypothetical protein